MAALHTEQLEYLLTKIVQRVGFLESLGVFPANCLPNFVRTETGNVDRCFIMNTDPLGKPGSHWLAFYYSCRFNTLEYFDSFGFPISFHKYVARELARRNIAVVPVNTFGMLQSPSTTACGYYCILFLHMRTRFRSALHVMTKIRKLGSSELARDSAVVDRVHKLIHGCKCSNSCQSVSFTRQSQSCVCSK
jgi:hypothetical protein